MPIPILINTLPIVIYIPILLYLMLDIWGNWIFTLVLNEIQKKINSYLVKAEVAIDL